jgi:molybdopterin-guanine dinucleotide biosynthesis protein A
MTEPRERESDARALAAIQPVVLVGGRSRRFGRDKLREPVAGAGASGETNAAGAWLVDRPIDALRAVFGARVAAVGECDPRVAARFDRLIPDEHPGAGPIGGVISALTYARAPVLVLAGDLVAITAAEVRALVDKWELLSKGSGATAGSGPAPFGHSGPASRLHARIASPLAILAIMAVTDRPEPCCALYMPEALPFLRVRLSQGRGGRSLRDALDPQRVALAPAPMRRLANINTATDLGAL